MSKKSAPSATRSSLSPFCSSPLLGEGSGVRLDLVAEAAFIKAHLFDDVRTLALKKVPEGVDIKFCLQQIEGWQLARKKLPRWAEAEGILYPPRISMEQCSSQVTAEYKRQVLERLLPPDERQELVDLTGGYGVDFSYLSPLFQHATYVEILPHLREIVRNNLPKLAPASPPTPPRGEGRVEISIADHWSPPTPSCSSPPPGEGLGVRPFFVYYIDPSRRDDAGRKVVQLEDCSPDVTTLVPELLKTARLIMIKLSPMLDISQALRALPNVSEVHVVSVGGECKELLMIITNQSYTTCSSLTPAPSPRRGELKMWTNVSRTGIHPPSPTLPGEQSRVMRSSDWGGLVPTVCQELGVRLCVNLDSTDPIFICSESDKQKFNAEIWEDALHPGMWVGEPNASILKAGVQDVLCSRFAIKKLHPHSHLFVSEEPVEDFPGRSFELVDYAPFNKKALKGMLQGIKKANLAVRNFPTSVAELRKQLKLAEGGDTYLFATTLSNNQHVLLGCTKSPSPWEQSSVDSRAIGDRREGVHG